MIRGQIILLEVRNEVHRDLILRVATISKRLGSIEMRIDHVQTPMVWCLMSRPIGNVVSGAEVETKAIQESAVGNGQDPHSRGRGKIVREDPGAGAERDVPVAKEGCN